MLCHRRAFLKTGVCAAIGTCVPARASSPAREFTQQAQRCRRLLKSSIIDFYLPYCVDQSHGGYFEDLRDAKFAPTGEKFLVLQGRQLWFFSTLAQAGIEKQAAIQAAASGYRFLEDHFRDRAQGGYFSKVADDGQPTDKRKHVYLNSFALYGLVAYYRAGGQPSALDAAKELFAALEAKAYDRRHGGYEEFFYDNWRAITDPKEPGYVGAIGTKTYNTHLHVLESLTELYRAWKDPLVQARLEELLHINTSTVHHPDFNCNIDGWLPDWKMVQTSDNLKASYGHDVECAWLALDAARALNLPATVLKNWADSLVAYSLKFGYDRRNGGFFYTGPLGRPAADTRKEWWVQAEALVSMLELFQLTGKKSYYDIFCQTLDFIEKHQIAPTGGWWATCTAEGVPLGYTRTSMWQGAYHSGRALLRSAEMLKEMAKKS